MERFDVQYSKDYGAPELKRLQARYSLVGLLGALVLHLIGVGTYWGSVLLKGNERYVTLAPTEISCSFSPFSPPPRVVVTTESGPGGSRTRFGIPVPIPDWKVDPDVEFRKQTDPDPAPVPGDPSLVPGGGQTIQREPTEPPPEFVPFEVAPSAVKQVQPKYPDLATRAGLEGTVWVKIWIDKEGRPRKAVVLKSDADIFNQPAADAAMQWVFTPAMMKSGPVPVWVSIPFRFTLQGK